MDFDIKKNWMYIAAGFVLAIILSSAGLLGTVGDVKKTVSLSKSVSGFIIKGESYSGSATAFEGTITSSATKPATCENYAKKAGYKYLFETHDNYDWVRDGSAVKSCRDEKTGNWLSDVTIPNYPGCLPTNSNSLMVWGGMGEYNNGTYCYTYCKENMIKIGTTNYYTSVNISSVLANGYNPLTNIQSTKNTKLVVCNSDKPSTVKELRITHNLKTLGEIEKVSRIMQDLG